LNNHEALDLYRDIELSGDMLICLELWPWQHPILNPCGGGHFEQWDGMGGGALGFAINGIDHITYTFK
tara:strand:+ start:661 stop:864 length:204 start_codon:yes stop_codon:yes gene_type:complete